MTIKSDEKITNQKSELLKSLCSNIGTASVECEGETNLSAVATVVSLFSTNNSIYKNYKKVLDEDGDHINSMGAIFSKFDRTIIR